jgi:hypothetical protein
MRIRDLRSWPPSTFKSADQVNVDCPTADLDHLHITAAYYIPGRRKGMPGDLVLVVKDWKSGEVCTARMRVDDPELGLKLETVLGRCRGVSLSQVGGIDLPVEGN